MLTSLAVVKPAAATILTFDQVRSAAAGNPVEPTVSGRDVPLDCGDRVGASVMDVPGGQFTYGQAGEGFTPNVTTQFYAGAASAIGPGVSLWQDRYGDLVNVLFANNASGFLAVRLTADPDHQVGRFGFDLAGWPNTDFLISSNSGGPRHSEFAFADELLLRIDFSNLAAAQHDNIVLDSLRFAQNPPWTPGPDDVPPHACRAGAGHAAALRCRSARCWVGAAARSPDSPRHGDVDHCTVDGRRYGHGEACA